MNCYDAASSVRLLPCTEQEFAILKEALAVEGKPFEPNEFDPEDDWRPHGFDINYVKDAGPDEQDGAFLYSEEESCSPFLLPLPFVKAVSEILKRQDRPYWTIGIAHTGDKIRAGVFGGTYIEITCNGRVRFQNELMLDWVTMSPTFKTAEVRLQGVTFDVWAIAVHKPHDRWDALAEEDQTAMEAMTDLSFSHGADLDKDSFIEMEDKMWTVAMLPAPNPRRPRGR